LTFALYAIALGYSPPENGALQGAGAFLSGWRAYAIAATFIFASIAASAFVVPMQAAVQRRAPKEIRSRVLAANNMANAAGAIIGFWLVLFVTRTNLSASDMFLAVGVAQTALFVYMRHRRKTLPEGLHDETLSNDEVRP
jgi:predicted MFS family arabinose efflux permease